MSLSIKLSLFKTDFPVDKDRVSENEEYCHIISDMRIEMGLDRFKLYL